MTAKDTEKWGQKDRKKAPLPKKKKKPTLKTKTTLLKDQLDNSRNNFEVNADDYIAPDFLQCREKQCFSHLM